MKGARTELPIFFKKLKKLERRKERIKGTRKKWRKNLCIKV